MNNMRYLLCWALMSVLIPLGSLASDPDHREFPSTNRRAVERRITERRSEQRRIEERRAEDRRTELRRIELEHRNREREAPLAGDRRTEAHVGESTAFVRSETHRDRDRERDRVEGKELADRLNRAASDRGNRFEEAVAETFREKIIRRNEEVLDPSGKRITELDFETREAIVEVGIDISGKTRQLHLQAEIAQQRAKRLDVIYGPDTAPRALQTIRDSLRNKWGDRVRFIPHGFGSG